MRCHSGKCANLNMYLLINLWKITSIHVTRIYNVQFKATILGKSVADAHNTSNKSIPILSMDIGYKLY